MATQPPSRHLTAALRELATTTPWPGSSSRCRSPRASGIRTVVDAIDPLKDIDGIHPLNAGLLRLGYEGFVPATAHAALEMIQRSGVTSRGGGRRHRSLAGRGHAARVHAREVEVPRSTVCHSKSRDLADKLRRADIVVVAAGRPGLVTGAMLKPGAVVIDVGINVVDGHLVGDVDFASAATSPSAITPVPGGVGPLTNALLLTHLVRAAQRQAAERFATAVTRRRMSFPSDLEIARSVTPRPIINVAHDLGLRDDEVELYGFDQGEDPPRGDRAAGGRAAARQVRAGDRHQPDPARRRQEHDDRRARAGPQPHRPQGRGLPPPAQPRAGVRDQGRRGGRRLQPGHPDGGLQPPPDGRRPRDRGGPQPCRGLPRQPHPPRQCPGDRCPRRPLAACRRHQRPRPAEGRRRPRRPRQRLSPRDAST